ncbi:MAG TPA: DUF6804 family protein [Candidatus Pacearchaeota archaeon]|jgi:hypothetical protein|nr:DUF6804 family protein [Candidatus Pacearchaeota archaeon]
MNSNSKFIFRCLSIFSLLLILPFPTEFYFFSRFIVFIGAIYAAIEVKKLNSSKGEPLFFFLCVIAFIFNPIIMIFLYSKALWAVLNILAAYAFFKAASLIDNMQMEKLSAQTNNTSEVEEKITSGRRSDNNYDRDLYTIKISEQIAGVVPLNLNKREQMVLGLIYLFYAIENLAKIHNEEKFANGGTGLFLNTVFIPKNYVVINDYLHSPLFIYEIEQIIKKNCTSKSISACLNRVRDEVILSVKPYFSYDDFKESGYQFIQDYCSSLDLDAPELFGFENGFFRLCRDESFTKQVKGELIKILEEADSNYKNKDELKNITDYIHTGNEWVVEEKLSTQTNNTSESLNTKTTKIQDENQKKENDELQKKSLTNKTGEGNNENEITAEDIEDFKAIKHVFYSVNIGGDEVEWIPQFDHLPEETQKKLDLFKKTNPNLFNEIFGAEARRVRMRVITESGV